MEGAQAFQGEGVQAQGLEVMGLCCRNAAHVRLIDGVVEE
jgi:hypothetical protein